MSFANKSTVTYKVWGLDVWGNEDDEWVVNDRRPIGVVSVRTDRKSKSGKWDVSNGALTKALVDGGYLKPGVTSDELSVDGEDDGVLFIEDSETGEPIFQLEYERAHQQPETSTGLFSEPSAESKPAKYNKENPTSFWTPTTMGLAGLGIVTIAAIGYGVWKGYQAQQQANAAGGAGGAAGGGQVPQLPSGGLTSQEMADQQDQVPPFVPGDYSAGGGPGGLT